METPLERRGHNMQMDRRFVLGILIVSIALVYFLVAVLWPWRVA
jgi:hypothetical protein